MAIEQGGRVDGNLLATNEGRGIPVPCGAEHKLLFLHVANLAALPCEPGQHRLACLQPAFFLFLQSLVETFGPGLLDDQRERGRGRKRVLPQAPQNTPGTWVPGAALEHHANQRRQVVEQRLEIGAVIVQHGAAGDHAEHQQARPALVTPAHSQQHRSNQHGRPANNSGRQDRGDEPEDGAALGPRLVVVCARLRRRIVRVAAADSGSVADTSRSVLSRVLRAIAEYHTAVGFVHR